MFHEVMWLFRMVFFLEACAKARHLQVRDVSLVGEDSAGDTTTGASLLTQPDLPVGRSHLSCLIMSYSTLPRIQQGHYTQITYFGFFFPCQSE